MKLPKINKKGQLAFLLSPPFITIILGAIIGYILAGRMGWDQGLATIIGGTIGFFVSTRLGI